jgi:hypothetical protein
MKLPLHLLEPLTSMLPRPSSSSRSPSIVAKTARLLARLLGGRTAGPVFLSDQRAPTCGRRAPAAADVDPTNGRLSHPRAEHLFKTVSASIDPPGKAWTLHKLRHPALTHPAAAGRTAPEPQAKSRHQQLANLGLYVRLREGTSAQITIEDGPPPATAPAEPARLRRREHNAADDRR